MRSSLDGTTKIAMHASCQVDCIQKLWQKSPGIGQFDRGCTVFSHAAPRTCTRRRQRRRHWQATGDCCLECLSIPAARPDLRPAMLTISAAPYCVQLRFLGQQRCQALLPPAAVLLVARHFMRCQALLAVANRLAAAASIEQRFQLAYMRGTQLLARQQGLHLLEDTVRWHRRQDGRGGARGDARRVHGPSFQRRCRRPCRAAGQQARQ